MVFYGVPVNTTCDLVAFGLRTLSLYESQVMDYPARKRLAINRFAGLYGFTKVHSELSITGGNTALAQLLELVNAVTGLGDY